MVLAGQTSVFVHDIIDDAKEKTGLEAEIKKLEGEITGSRKKLENENFTSRAPAEGQRQRLAELEAQKKTLETNLAALG